MQSSLATYFLLLFPFVYGHTDHLWLVNEVQRNALSYIPRIRFKSEVENCDVVSHDEIMSSPLTFVNVLTTSNVNRTILDRDLIGTRKYYYRKSFYGGESHTRYRKLFLETKQHRMGEFQNCKWSQ